MDQEVQRKWDRGDKGKERRGRPIEYGQEVEEEVMKLVLETSPKEGGVWTLNKLKKALGDKSSLSTIRRMLQKGGVRWQQTKRFLVSKDPEFEMKVREIREVMVNPD